jgi:integrase
LLCAGLRLGEALGKRLKNLDFDKMVYLVNRGYKLHRFKKPKFEKSRIVDLPAYLVEEFKDYIWDLQKQNLRQGRGAIVDLLFIDSEERGIYPYSQRKVQRLVKKGCKAAVTN